MYTHFYRLLDLANTCFFKRGWRDLDIQLFNAYRLKKLTGRQLANLFPISTIIAIKYWFRIQPKFLKTLYPLRVLVLVHQSLHTINEGKMLTLQLKTPSLIYLHTYRATVCLYNLKIA